MNDIQNKINEIYKEMGISDKVIAISDEIESGLSERFAAIDKVAEYNQKL
mgnify:FL=1